MSTAANINNGDAKILHGHLNIGYGWDIQQSIPSLPSWYEGFSRSAQPGEFYEQHQHQSYQNQYGPALQRRLHPIIESYIDPVLQLPAYAPTTETFHGLDYPAMDESFGYLNIFGDYSVDSGAQEVSQSGLNDDVPNSITKVGHMYHHGSLEPSFIGALIDRGPCNGQPAVVPWTADQSTPIFQ